MMSRPHRLPPDPPQQRRSTMLMSLAGSMFPLSPALVLIKVGPSNVRKDTLTSGFICLNVRERHGLAGGRLASCLRTVPQPDSIGSKLLDISSVWTDQDSAALTFPIWGAAITRRGRGRSDPNTAELATRVFTAFQNDRLSPS